MTEEKSKISEALKNFSNFFNVPGYSIDAWQKSYPWLFNRQEDISFVSQIMQSIDFRNDSYLRTALYIAEEYKNKEFDSSLEFEMRGSFSKIDQLFGINLILQDGFLNKLVEEISRLCKSNQRNPKAVIDWIEEYLAKINLDEIRGILMDFCDKSALKKWLKMAQESAENAAKVQKTSEELSEKLEKKIQETEKQKTELNATGNWEKHFDQRASDIKTEIKESWIRKKIRILRACLYAIAALLIFVEWDFVGKLINSTSLNPADYKIQIAVYGRALIAISLSVLLLLSIVSYHLKHALRELNILKQMRASYLHRAITAKTFKELVASGHFKDARDKVVVKEAAMAMFKKDSVGYLSKDQLEPSNTPVQEVVGIFRKG